ncbi:hypothetical protein JOC95_001304 [Bacillus tianshenii]|uniref:Imidazoleglycerol-phosphate dehydratase n=1 Tax=Sutcliffiella tianshenii TaxID=1463404 RepID=A0ABS2NXS3_9BACI|nr:hypothetical protein [Bacillus tianshenii]MBM7619455.1 hypothetical protein [Bacillus tianshenii]MCA1321159.1 hypothetical protein [Bacillus tianshenii]
MTKKYNRGGSQNQNSPTGESLSSVKHVAGDNSKGNKRNKDQKDKTEL